MRAQESDRPGMPVDQNSAVIPSGCAAAAAGAPRHPRPPRRGDWPRVALDYIEIRLRYDTRICGDGYIDTDTGETCDDGNTKDGDGCSATCLIE